MLWLVRVQCIGENYEDMGMFMNVESVLGQIGIEDGDRKQIQSLWIYLVQLDCSGRALLDEGNLGKFQGKEEEVMGKKQWE